MKGLLCQGAPSDSWVELAASGPDKHSFSVQCQRLQSQLASDSPAQQSATRSHVTHEADWETIISYSLNLGTPGSLENVQQNAS